MWRDIDLLYELHALLLPVPTAVISVLFWNVLTRHKLMWRTAQFWLYRQNKSIMKEVYLDSIKG